MAKEKTVKAPKEPKAPKGPSMKSYSVTRRFIVEKRYEVNAISGKEAKVAANSSAPAETKEVREISGTVRRNRGK